ncbi:SMI1/KNR4 family protein [Sphingomonas morindae]|uniref:SMI1/KNR4 family protein n=1 Tax=Sphingomonas morindae TaxID=1541170 RepID=A0ABY4X9U5_9SPHN|nr:SMI1/KNR4 family protein [Sphingomonas morindae]USI73475.1 SMI1/KNR4 family protein [Sphingomonas morindae]
MDTIYDYGPFDKIKIIEFGNKHGVSLPESYVGLMEKHNGAQLEKDSFKYTTADIEDWLSFRFCGFGGWPVLDRIEKYQNMEYLFLEKYMIFGLTGAGDYLAFVPEGNPPENHVKLIIHDDYEEGPHGDQMRIVDVARNFDEFLAGLIEVDD